MSGYEAAADSVDTPQTSGAPVEVQLCRRGDHELPIPDYATSGSAGIDLHAASAHRLEPGERGLIGTGFAMALPPGCEGQIRPRSGMAARHGVTVLNAPGTVDSDYRGEVKVLLINLGTEAVEIAAADRIAQLVVAPVQHLRLVEVADLPDTTRGAGGFGSTGT